MSRLPRHLEHLRTGFTAEAVAAASYRAYAEQAESDGKPNLARRWRGLADEKDLLARELFHAAGRVDSDGTNLRDAIAEERYENEVLYPRMVDDMEDLGQPVEASLLRRLIETQQRHLGELDALRRELTAATADVRAAEAAAAR